MKVKLYRFSLKGIKDVLYLYSLQTGEEYLRGSFSIQDHGGSNYVDYIKLYTEGKIKRITNISQIPEEDQGIIPYNANELDNYGFDLRIKDFFDEKILKRYN